MPSIKEQILNTIESSSIRIQDPAKLKSELHVYQSKEVSNVFFPRSSSLAFTKSISQGNNFVNPKNLIFHRTLIQDCTFSGSLLNVVFNQCFLRRVDFTKAQLTKLSFSKVWMQDVSGLPPEHAEASSKALPHQKRRL